MNYQQLYVALQDYTQNFEPNFVANIPTFIRQAERRIYNTVQLSYLRKNQIGTLTANNKYLSAPADFLSVYSLAVVDGTGKYNYLITKDVNYIREVYPEPAVTGLPKYYAIFGPTISSSQLTNDLSFILGPTPSSAYSVELHYYFYPPSIVAGVITTLGAVTGGSGYTNGVYYNVPLEGGAGIGATATYSENLRTTVLSGPTTSAVATIATLWTAPSTAGTYTVSLGVSDGVNTASTTSPTPSLAASITVTVVAASSGGTYSAAYSACNTATTTTTGSTTYPSGVDASSTPVANGGSWYIDFDADDAYDASLPATTNVVISATNGAYVSIGTAGTAPAAGTASTVATTVAPTNKNVRITQGAAGPVTTTVTITINGIVACTKTVTIAGEVAKLAISGLGTQALSTNSSTVYDSRDADADGRTDGLFTVKATDSAGNLVATSTVGTFSYVASTLTPTVQMVTVNSSATTNSSTSAYSTSLGAWTCGSSAGTSNVKIQYTNTGTGTVITSDAFAARCAGAPDTYTASFDKASYVQGEIATLTVKFVDSKGNPANQARFGTQATSITTPMLTAISATASATSYPKADGSRVYTFAVGIPTGITAGKYTAVVNYPDLTDVNATKATPGYSVSTGSTDVSFTEILKSVVALIASINKQIQALQKLILKR